jgi:hypothetical protein
MEHYLWHQRLSPKGDCEMKKNLPLYLLMLAMILNACSPHAAGQPVLSPTGESTQALATEGNVPPNRKGYSNSAFGLSFQYPSNWFGPDEYISDQTLRVAVGSDVVLPYGESSDQPSDVKNSYLIVIQYTQNDQAAGTNDVYQSLVGIKDGESLSTPRSLTTRIRQLSFGKFTGFEYITTLPETAQTEHVYSRNVILTDGQSRLLTVFGTPNNVEVGNGEDWRNVYQSIDVANQEIFHAVLESITVN